MNARKIKNSLVAPLLMLLFTACAIPYETATSRTVVRVSYTNPAWAPAYHAGIRYYYFPDIEAYYDLQNRDFVYLQDGRWFFSNELPPYYGDFDLYHAYVVSLNIDVYQPWRHHHYYVANYPRYYYRNYYRNNHDYDGIRGFNENDRHPIYRPDYHRIDNNGDRGRRPNNWNDNDGRRGSGYDTDRRKTNDNATDSRRWNDDTRATRYGNDVNRNTPSGDNRTTRTGNESGRDNQSGTNATPAATRDGNNGNNNTRYSREPQEPNYYGRNIGRPVPVEHQMREPKPTKTESKGNGESRSTGGRR